MLVGVTDIPGFEDLIAKPFVSVIQKLLWFLIFLIFILFYFI